MAARHKGQSKFDGLMRVSPLKPGLRGSQNWMAAQVRAAKHSPKAMMHFIARVIGTFLVLIFIALWLGGFLPTIRHNLHVWKVDRLMSAGFVVDRVDVMGEGRLNEQDIRMAAQIHRGSYFFGVDLEAARARTESLPWVERAVIRRLWPNRIVVQVVETTPYAMWQQGGNLHLLAETGEPIIPVEQAQSVPEGLKLYVGEASPEDIKTIETALQQHAPIWTGVDSLVRFPSGRWDLHMTSGTIIRLPVGNVAPALTRLAELDRTSFILSREVATIDLRLSDRIGLTPKHAIEAQSS